MNCQELIDLLLDYVGGELVVEQHRTVEIHLTGCSHCVRLVESYRHTIRFARGFCPSANVSRPPWKNGFANCWNRTSVAKVRNSTTLPSAYS